MGYLGLLDQPIRCHYRLSRTLDFALFKLLPNSGSIQDFERGGGLGFWNRLGCDLAGRALSFTYLVGEKGGQYTPTPPGSAPETNVAAYIYS